MTPELSAILPKRAVRPRIVGKPLPPRRSESPGYAFRRWAGSIRYTVLGL